MTDLLVIFLKWPESGKVKTRLGKDLGYQKSAEIYKFLVSTVIKRISPMMDDSNTICWCFDPNYREMEIKNWIQFELDNLNINNIKDQIFWPQSSGNLGERLKSVFNKFFEEGFQKIIAIGTDCILINDILIKGAFELLDLDNDIVFGPCLDGGYYLIGIKNFKSCVVFEEIPWSTDRVLNSSLRKAEKYNLRYMLLKELFDVDTIKDFNKLGIEISDFES